MQFLCDWMYLPAPNVLILNIKILKKEKYEWTRKRLVLSIIFTPYILEDLVFLVGGYFQNTEDLIKPLVEIRKGLRKDQDIWIYSGYTWEQIIRDKSKTVIKFM